MGDSAVHRPPPTATGKLAKTPLLHLLLYMLDKKLSGTLELLAPDKRSVVAVFVEGRPAKVRTSEPIAHLGRVLLELGFLTEEQLTRSLADLAKEKAAGKKLHGEVLIANGAIDGVKLATGLCEQIARKLRHAAGMPPETAYGYYDGFNQLAAWGRDATEGIDPFPVLWTLLREYPPWDQITPALEKVGASPLRLRGADVARLGLTGGEATAVDLMRARALRTTELAKAGQLNDRTAQLLAYLLLVTKQVDVLPAAPSTSPPPPSFAQRLGRPPTPMAAMRPGAEGTLRPPAPGGATSPATTGGGMKPPTPGSPMKPATPVSGMKPGTHSSIPPGGAQGAAAGRASIPPMPPGLSPQLVTRWREIAERATTIDRTDYFNMLDVPRDATAEEIESAYFALAKVWHPDRLPSELAPVRDACSRVFSRMSEARATLADAKQRERYMKLVADGSGSPEMQETVARVVEASTSFQKAEVCFKRNDLAQAEEFCRKALELDDTQPDYHAMLAWLLALKPENHGADKTLECIRMLDRAVQISSKCEKAYYWRGMLYKRVGRNEQAARDFRKVADLNPRNIDAAREVRLFNMRGGRGSVPPPAPGRDGEKGGARGERGEKGEKGEEKGGLLGRFFKKS
jgi:tetratricopeptide (TPR) repeat protein